MLTNSGFKNALAILFSVHQQLEPKDNKEFIYKAWYKMLHDIADNELLDTVTRFVIETPRLYPGDNFIAILRQMAKPRLYETEGDAIELAFEAARNFGHTREVEAMAWLETKSPLIAAAVQRFGYRDICRSEEPDVIRGQLRAIFKSEKERASLIGAVVPSAKSLESGIVDIPKMLAEKKKDDQKRLIQNGVKTVDSH